MTLTAGYHTLARIDSAAHFYPGEEPKPAQVATINGIEFQVRYILVKRSCYDNLATPTAQYKVNGKRVSRNKAYDLAQEESQP